jgi:hypothetical protein
VGELYTLCDLLKITNYIIEAHAKCHMREMDYYELSEHLFFVFNNVEVLTEAKTPITNIKHHVNKCKYLSNIVLHQFNKDIGSDDAVCGFWAPFWSLG